ncbi:MAG TPA: excinuclease ABC subunit UvrC [Bacillota bacterium]|jgi:excinuclease ABC subunit C|nr:excinuclease ABC subunit UvrC [Peptococcaceae bacterium MAG4]NLW38170.1 excinuclease ABC subunit UvrC [Peptococcaceae bacterium]HPZ43600.1 excinuclease ABC subunit UvrC [Bacillota bacterium]HQD76111.1 excinuclease ABC subunit UvrC [Bacillota bacterium]HUM58813.1 excinuclease ABC subunit UvrC [Bacillota bacterium]
MQLEEKLKHIPAKPGVYLYRDSAGKILYVGKAVSLKNRVRSYFQPGAQLPPKTRVLVDKVADLDYIVTDSEVEALILEQNLIKEHRPRYNVLLKDDKSYPYLKVTLGDDYPRVMITRRHVKDGSRYFGPYTRVGAVNETLRLLKKLFPFRSCRKKEPEKRERPCLNYHIQRCLGPCCGLVDREKYRAMIREVCLFLEGRQEDLVRQLTARMEEAAERLDFEQAARLRDQIRAVGEVIEKQKIISGGFEDQDVAALAETFDEACVMLFLIRGGKLIGSEHFMLEGTEGLSRSEIITAFVKQYYNDAGFIPGEILLSEDIGEEKPVIEAWLSDMRGAKVVLKTPRRGEKKKLVEMAARNALLALEQARLEKGVERDEIAGALADLARGLGLEQPPRRLECYDVSNTQGAESVASMVVFEEGKPARDQYRRFKIRTVEGPDDFASLQEVLRRRFTRALEERELMKTGQLSSREARFHLLPDLVIIDGGKGQLSAARQVMRELGFDRIPTFGLAKEEEQLFAEGRPDPIILPAGSRALHLLQRLRDEAHRFALSYHRKLRGKAGLKSLLEEVEGIGEVRRRELLKAFGSLAEIEKASLEELAAVKGMNKKAARAVYDFFHRT